MIVEHPAAIRYGDQPPGLLPVAATFLEMRKAPDVPVPPPPVPDLAVKRLDRPSVEGYRYLYGAVGQPWLWYERCQLSDDAVAAIIQDARVDVLVLTKAGRVAGFAEIDRRPVPDADLIYFGLLPRFIGQGLGFWFLAHAVAFAWSHAEMRRLRISTCTFDHPVALALYQRAGFVPVERRVRRIPDPRLNGVLPRTAAPHIPLARQTDSESAIRN